MPLCVQSSASRIWEKFADLVSVILLVFLLAPILHSSLTVLFVGAVIVLILAVPVTTCLGSAKSAQNAIQYSET